MSDTNRLFNINTQYDSVMIGYSRVNNQDINRFPCFNNGVIQTDISCNIKGPRLDDANCLLIKISSHTAIVAIDRPHCFIHNVQRFLNSFCIVM